MEFEKVRKKNSDRPTHTGETGSAKGKQKYFKVGLKGDKSFRMLKRTKSRPKQDK